MSEMVNFALNYAAIGWYVYPCKPGMKEPLIKDNLNEASTDPEKIKAWWTKWPDANIGVSAGKSELVAVDEDEKNGKHGIDEFQKYTSGLYLFFGPTCTSRTPTGGRHRIFRSTKHKGISQQIDWLPGVDIRAGASGFMVPPSIIDGVRYQWELDPGECEPLSEDDDEAVETLLEILEAFQNEGNGSGTGRELIEASRNDNGKIPHGLRHSYVVSRCGEIASLMANNTSAEAMLELVATDYEENCEDPYDDETISQFRRKYLKTLKKFISRKANEPPQDWSYNMAAWKAEHPGSEFVKSKKAWNEVRLAGERAREAGKTFEASSSENSDQPDLDRFHLHNDKGKATGAYDYKIHRYLKEAYHIFVLGGIPYIYEDGAYRPDLNGARLKTMIRKLIYPQFVRSTTIKRIYDLFIADAELQRSFEDLNRYPSEWICFHNGFYDPISKQMIPHDPKYLAINQTPYEFDPEADPEGGTIKKWLDFITEDPEDREMLLQYAGYCLTRDTRQQKFLILRGEGGTGKSIVINLIEQMIGPENISNISLSQLTQRFAPFNLLGKLLNSCADLEVTALEDVSTIKKILGEDSMSGEAKGKDLISFRSYAKLIFSTNELPIVKAERTSGFYRRLLILRMDKLPEVRAPDFFKQLSAEIDYFIHECVKALCRMYEAGTITESNGSIAEVQRLRCDSDTVEAFLNDQIVFDNEGFILRKRLFQAYSVYCHDMERQALTKNNFFKAMRTRGFSERKVNAGAQRGMPAFSGISFSETSAETSAEGFLEADEIEIPFNHED